MSTLQIHILAGPQTGARLQLNQSPVTFGRSADCTLILDLPVVSRLHGELQLDEEGQWVLVNHSSNGTRVGRKKATKKPVPLSEGAAITIGDTEVFRVHFESAPADTTAEQNDSDEQPIAQHAPGAGLKGRSKLWIGLGIWFAICILAMVFFATLGGGDKNNSSASAGFYYPGKEIEDKQGDEAGILAIRRLLSEPPVYQDPNASRYSSHLDRANRAADQGSTDLYEAYRQYQLAISFSDNREQPFDDNNDVLRYGRVLDELAEIIYTRYIYAYRAYHNNEFRQAHDVLFKLREEYYRNEDPDDALANHIRKLRNAAHRRSN